LCYLPLSKRYYGGLGLQNSTPILFFVSNEKKSEIEDKSISISSIMERKNEDSEFSLLSLNLSNHLRIQPDSNNEVSIQFIMHQLLSLIPFDIIQYSVQS
jgi:hypothetical protein